MNETAQARYEYVAKPSRNFNILGHTSITDPWDGREKYVLSNFALGGTGTVVLIDVLTGDGESFALPVGNGAWGIVNWHDEKLVIGTCVDQAYLHVFDLKSRTWAEPLPSVGESYFWQMTIGSDDKIYGGTYPGCSLMQYDPIAHSLVNLGRVSDNAKNMYSRPVFGEAPGYILVNFGFDTNGWKAYHIESGTFRPFGLSGATMREISEDYICMEGDGIYTFYDPKTLEPIEDRGCSEMLSPRTIILPNGQKNPFIRLKSGKLAGNRGQEYFIIDAPSSLSGYEQPLNVKLKRIPVEAPDTEVFTLVPDNRGRIWGSSGFGQTIFRFDPATGEFWNSSSVCNHGGEVYGMVFVGDKLFLAAYVGGDHIVYDPDQPWDQLNNVNPRTLRSVGPDLIRPHGRSVIGPDGGVWTGWWAKYGVYGGGLSRVDPATLEVESWYDPIPGQAVAGLAADDEYIYFTTNGHANGLEARRDIRCHLAIWKPGTGLVHTEMLPEGEQTDFGLCAANGKAALCVGKQIRIYDAEARKFEREVPIEDTCDWILKLDERKVGAFCGKLLYEIDLFTGNSSVLSELPGRIRAATVTADGNIYFSVKTALYVLKSGKRA